MKKLLFSLVMILFAFNNYMRANTTSYYYAKGAAVSSPTAGGYVYVSKRTATPPSSYNQTSANDTIKTTTSGAKFKFYFYAQAKPGYSFTGWTNEAGENLGTQIPLMREIAASSTASGTNTETYTANFVQKVTATITFEAPTNGSYTATDGTNTVTNSGTMTTEELITMTATPASGYKVYGWYTKSGSTKTYFSMFSNTVSQAFTSNTTVGVDFILADTPVFQIKGSTSEFYTNLNDAINAVGSTSSVIVLVSNGTVSAGNYTIAAKTTLLIPYDAAYTVETTTPTTTTTHTAYSIYKKLKLADGANLTVNGAICVGGTQISTGNGLATTGYGPGNVTGPYGCIDMSEGGQITLNNGSKLYAWGFITGQNKNQGNNTSGVGTIDALSGSSVYENFVIANWRGGGNTACLGNTTTYKVFPFNNYFIPNIEVPLTINYGATENVVSNAYMSDEQKSFPFAFISSSNGFFKLSSGASLKKWYDATTDYMCVETRGDCAISSISLSVSISIISTTIKSSDFVLPITSNLDIRVESGTLSVPYDLGILPGARLKIGSAAAVSLSANLYMYDLDDWDLYALSYYYYSYEMRPTAHFNRTGWTSKAKLADAKLDVCGTLNVSGKLYSTTNGANICSSGAGKIVFSAVPTASATTYQVLGSGATATNYETSLLGKYTVYCTAIPVQAPWLQNADGTHVETAGTATGTTYYYYRGAWTTTMPTTVDGDVDGDGEFTTSDVDAIANIIVGKDPDKTLYNHDVADMDGNGSVNLIDLTLLVNLLKGK